MNRDFRIILLLVAVLDSTQIWRNLWGSGQVHFKLLPGHLHDTVGVAPLIDGVDFGALLSDKAFDPNWIVEAVNKRGATAVISQMRHRTELP